MITIQGLYDQGLLLPANYAGIDFWMLDSKDSAGRRVQRFLFPGQDQAAWQDLGQAQGEIQISGIYVGDDYADFAQQMRAAFQSAGPATLTHPWLGEIQVMQAPGRLPEFTFKQDELRVLRFTASFFPWTAPPAVAADTLGDLAAAIGALQAAAEGLLAAVLAIEVISLTAVGMVESFAAQMVGIWNGLVAAAAGAASTWTEITSINASAAVAPAVAAPIAALGVISGIPISATYSAQVGATLAAVSSAIAATSAPLQPAAVAPGGPLQPPPPVDGRITANLILSAVGSMAVMTNTIAPAPLINTAAQMLALADAVSAISTIGFQSQQEASQWLQTATAALSGTAAQAALLVPAQPTAAGTAWRALVGLQSALAVDMTATMGRLPAVTAFSAPASVPVWLLAQYLSGDRPGNVVSVYLDIVARNNIPNPAYAPAGNLEVLLQ